VSLRGKRLGVVVRREDRDAPHMVIFWIGIGSDVTIPIHPNIQVDINPLGLL
jgi:hypothetical protein